jgi:hypothetical protein
MLSLRLPLLLLSLSLAVAQWDTQCKAATGGPYSSWNETRCPSDRATCCGSGFSPSGVGCCALPGATCCGDNAGGTGGYACCPAGTACTVISGAGTYGAVYNCTAPGGASTGLAISVCKGGPMLPMSTTKKNVLWIGDSLSIGMMPHVAANLSDIALVQHAPAGGDGGAEETAYGVYCLEFFLASPSGMGIKPDLILFNWGMHDGPMSNDTTPGQNAPPTNYAAELSALTVQLKARAAAFGAKLAFAHTTPFICTAAQDGCVQNLNNQADAIMAANGVPVLKTYEAVIAQCGPAPQAQCFGEKGCWCPHCTDAGYAWLAGTVVAPALRAMLTASD